MRRQDLVQILAYILVSTISVSGAFIVSLRLLTVSKAEDQASRRTSEPPPQPEADNPTAASADNAGKSAASSGIDELEGFLEPFIYDIVNRRDPFQAYADYTPQGDQNGGESAPRALSPAQRFELEQLRLIGIMWDVKEPRAMFMDPEQEVLVLGRDESIGNHNGYIAAIREGEVVVVESLRKRGDIIYRTKVLRIDR
jgi:type IV pilus assembly protein PilP